MWEVKPKKLVIKNLKKIPAKVKETFFILKRELEILGPYRTNWPNYGALKGIKNTYHCHIKKGKPTYVAVWCVENNEINIMEVTYVGTHEKAPY